jgi:hypothetical protein
MSLLLGRPSVALPHRNDFPSSGVKAPHSCGKRNPAALSAIQIKKHLFNPLYLGFLLIIASCHSTSKLQQVQTKKGLMKVWLW